MSRPRSYRLIGIDFGTTYSGVGWAWSERFRESPGIVKQWDGINGRETRAKVPTKILYQNGVPTKWGFQVAPQDKCLRWFKLLLLEEDDLPADVRDSKYIKEARSMLKELQKDAVDVVADYLKLLWEHVLKEMKARDGEAAVKGSPLWVVITIPAIWPVYAKNRMEQAATAAGLKDTRLAGETRLDWCPEPEAAALAVMEDDDGHPVQSRDVFVVCDAGGGTVDLITYELQNSERREMSECAKGTGDMCGSIFVDERFDENVPLWVNAKKWRKISDSKKEQWKEERWEGDSGLKGRFDGEQRDWRLRLPYEYFAKTGAKFKFLSKSKERRAIRDNELILSRDDVATVFNKAMDRTIALVKNQIEQTKTRQRRNPNAVFLVGGFGQSPYLYSRLHAEFKPLGIDVRKAPQEYSWSAICRGALIRAQILHAYEGGGLLRVSIGTRVSRMSYGITYMEPFVSGRHHEDDKKFIQSVNQDCAVNQMFWYMKASEDLPDQTVRRYDWRRTLRSPPLNDRITVTLMRCDSDNPPARLTDSMRPECEIVCEVTTPFNQLTISNEHNGETWRQVNFELELRSHGTAFEFAAYYNGVRQPAVTINPPYSVQPERQSTEPSRSPPRAPRRSITPLLLTNGELH